MDAGGIRRWFGSITSGRWHWIRLDPTGSGWIRPDPAAKTVDYFSREFQRLFGKGVSGVGGVGGVKEAIKE